MNCKELIIKLDKIGVPRAAYSILGDNLAAVGQNGGYSLEYNAESNRRNWEIAFYNNGTRDVVDRFESEAGVCETFYYLLGKAFGKKWSLVFEENPEMNCERLSSLLIENEVSPHRYSIPGEHRWIVEELDFGCSLEHKWWKRRWEIYYWERGQKSLVYSFHTESTACEEMYCMYVPSARVAPTDMVSEASRTLEDVNTLSVDHHDRDVSNVKAS
ncbi:MAG: hypothetical protein IKX88_12415 [Thermoguttaceae bacterium]|nr:hypothetical protein [Thermoguttaceae bacterium]